MRARFVVLALLVGGCASMSAPDQTASPTKPSAPATASAGDPFIVVKAKDGDTAESLAVRHLRDAGKSWMIEDYMGARTFKAGQMVVIPTRDWNPSGVEAGGYHLVPILCYHNLGEQAKGRLVISAQNFERQMRYLKSEGYRVITLAQFLEWTRLKRQLPRKSVVLTFDDGYRAFRQYAYPVLKELGFNATLFVYTDYVGAGRNALSWDDLRALAAEGFDVEAHSKTHADLRRATGESDAEYTRRMQAELAEPLRLFQQRLGRPSHLLAYPYGRVDDNLIVKVREYGYEAAFTVHRQSSPAFVDPLRVHRSQVYSEMTLEEFVRNLNVFQAEDLR